MGMKKAGAVIEQAAPMQNIADAQAVQQESGATAAIGRLSKPKAEAKPGNIIAPPIKLGNNHDGEPKQLESGATAAIGRLSKPKAEAKPAYKARDFDAEALGKTRCVQFEAALMSPALAGLRFDTVEQFLDIVRKAADAGVAYSFQK